MNQVPFVMPQLTEDRYNDVRLYLGEEYQSVARHSYTVAVEAKRLAERFDEDQRAAEIAGLLHDISAVIPNEKRIDLAESLDIDVLHSERKLPMIIHQKLSKYMAKELFGINDESILSAIECHTTLKKEYSRLDLIVFLADKIKWDRPGEPPYLSELLTALDTSLEEAALIYLDYLLNSKPVVIHPWATEAQEKLREQTDKGKTAYL
ncbi:bis(5'-nucleosyl)-tetraphosphatase (symmetrical) YqeK [Enterococcus sp. AZ126]|uniref:bis(5'-nucleosyl)-tetraphosphatase (symmetrical) YqeK n=1 Tax=Enterococcus sp. AZ126 TaxID=2774635 RepID=UPI003F245C6F